MKTYLVLLLVVMVFIEGCNDIPSDVMAIQLPGTYVRASSHEGGREWDTLVITRLNPSVGQYRVQRNWRYERVLDGERLAPLYKEKVSTAFFDKAARLLRETSTGKTLSIMGRKQLLYYGAVSYQKIR